MNQDRRADTGLDRLPGELVDWLAKPFASFLRIETGGGAILLVVTIAALVLSNSPWADHFLTFWELPGDPFGPCQQPGEKARNQ